MNKTIAHLVKLADRLDARGRSDLADKVDAVIKAAKDETSETDPTDEEVAGLWKE
jgi:hypothetical protein